MAAVSFDALGGTETLAVGRITQTGMAIALTSCEQHKFRHDQMTSAICKQKQS